MKKVKQIVKQNLRLGDSLHNNRRIRTQNGVPGGIRTHDPLLRRQPLYPAELQGHIYYSNLTPGWRQGQVEPAYPSARHRP